MAGFAPSAEQLQGIHRPLRPEWNRSSREDPLDLFIIDLFMPGGDGREVIRTIRGEHPTARFLTLSGAASDNRLGPAPAKLRLYRGEPFRYRRRDSGQEFIRIRLLIVLF